MKIERVRRLAFRTISQIGIHYPQSPLSQALPGLPATAPQAGDRFPWMRLALEPNATAVDLFQKLDDMRFNLIVIGQDSPPQIEGLDDLLRVFAIPDDPVNERELARVGIRRPSFYLLRPDGHVGLAGTGLDTAAIARYASERMRLGMK
jgi:hypothetical protein